MKQRKQGLAVTYAIAKVKMLEFLETYNITSATPVTATSTTPTLATAMAAETFKTSDAWMSSFMKRYKLAWRCHAWFIAWFNYS